MKNRNPITLITGAILALIFLFMLFTFQVRQTEVAVVTTFGKFSRGIDRPGFQFRLPWPIERVYEFDNRLQNFESKLDQSITKDQINILSKVYVGWRIGDPRVFLERFEGDLLAAERTLEPVVRNAKNEVLGSHAFSELISTNEAELQFDRTTNEAELQFDRIEQEILDRLRTRAQADYGIRVELLGLKQLNLPESITSTVFERMRAERQRLVARYQTEGEREAKILRANADGLANEILAKARAESIRIGGEAELQAQRFYSTFEKSPELAVFLFQLKALEQSLKERTHLILDQQTPPFNLLQGGAATAGPRR
jgi:membrane protease subunit HflC